MPRLQSTATSSRKSKRTDWTYDITKTKYGLYISILTDGTRMVTGMTEEAVRDVTDTIHIPVMKGEFDGYTSTPRKGVVDGKL